MREREREGEREREREREGGGREKKRERDLSVYVNVILCTCDSLRVFLFCIVLETIEAICFQRAFEAVSHSVCVSVMCSITTVTLSYMHSAHTPNVITIIPRFKNQVPIHIHIIIFAAAGI